MIRRDDHGQRGQARIKHCQPAPARSERADDGDGDEDRPADMHGRHGGQLVRVKAADGRVDRLVVNHGGVDQAGTRQHPGRRYRQQLHQEAQSGERHQGGAPSAVVAAMPDEQPYEARDQNREVQGVVVEIEELDEQRVRQEDMLERGLARQPEGPLELQIQRDRLSAPSGPISANEPASCHSAKRPRTRALSLVKVATEVSFGLRAALQRNGQRRQSGCGPRGLPPAQLKVNHARGLAGRSAISRGQDYGEMTASRRRDPAQANTARQRAHRIAAISPRHAAVAPQSEVCGCPTGTNRAESTGDQPGRAGDAVGRPGAERRRRSARCRAGQPALQGAR